MKTIEEQLQKKPFKSKNRRSYLGGLDQLASSYTGEPEAQVVETSGEQTNRVYEVTREELSREDLSREKNSRDGISRDETTRDENSLEEITREAVTREAVTRDELSRETTSLEERSREQLSREETTRDESTLEKETREEITGDETSLEKTTREVVTREGKSRESKSGGKSSRDKSSREKMPKRNKRESNPSIEAGFSGQTVEDQFCQLPNGLVDKLVETEFTLNELRIILFLVRNTLGWKSELRQIEGKRFKEDLGFDDGTLWRCMKPLTDGGYVIKQGQGGRIANTWGLNPKFFGPLLVKKRSREEEKGEGDEEGNTCEKLTCENITCENNTCENITCEKDTLNTCEKLTCPPYINKENTFAEKTLKSPTETSNLWNFFSEQRKKYGLPEIAKDGRQMKICKDLIQGYGLDKSRSLVLNLIKSKDAWVIKNGHSLITLGSNPAMFMGQSAPKEKPKLSFGEL